VEDRDAETAPLAVMVEVLVAAQAEAYSAPTRRRARPMIGMLSSRPSLEEKKLENLDSARPLGAHVQNTAHNLDIHAAQ
jgi:hypothetical protein